MRDQLIPFTPETARIAAARSVEARRVKREAAKLADAATASEVAGVLASFRQSFERGDLGENAAAAASWLIGRVVTGRIPVRHASDAAALLTVLVDVARLEAGEPTSLAVVGHVSGSDRVRELQRRARAAIEADAVVVSAAAEAVADHPSHAE